METFDELFNSFFNNKGKKTKPKSRRKDIDKGIKNIIDALSNFKEINKDNTENEHEDLDVEMGEPTKVQYFQNDGLYFKRSIWHVENNGQIGELVKLEVSDTPFEDYDSNKTLEECLQDALDEENYEKAAEIRDKINKLKK